MAGEFLYGIYDIGHTTKGIRDNAIDLLNTWALRPSRRAEFGKREIEDLEDAKNFLDELLEEIKKPKQEAA